MQLVKPTACTTGAATCHPFVCRPSWQHRRVGRALFVSLSVALNLRLPALDLQAQLAAQEDRERSGRGRVILLPTVRGTD